MEFFIPIALVLVLILIVASLSGKARAGGESSHRDSGGNPEIFPGSSDPGGDGGSHVHHDNFTSGIGGGFDGGGCDSGGGSDGGGGGGGDGGGCG